jgi:Ca2+-binding EF-hand superfamily protein
MIAERLYAVFDRNHNEYLDISEFLEGMMTLFSESYDKLSKFIFSFYDFDKDGYISKEDIRTVLSYIPIRGSDASNVLKKFKLKLEKEDFKDRVESQDELHELLDRCFRNSNLLDYNAFLKVVENVSSDIFLYILIFLLEKRPFSKKALEEYQGQRKYNTLFKVTKTPNPKLKSRFMVASPNLNSKFSPSVTIKKSPFWHTRNLINGAGSQNSHNTPNILQNNLNLINNPGGTNGSKAKHTDFLSKFARPSQPTTIKNQNVPSKFSKTEHGNGNGQSRVHSANVHSNSNVYTGNISGPRTIIIDDNVEMKSEESLPLSIDASYVSKFDKNVFAKNSKKLSSSQIPNGNNGKENGNNGNNPHDEDLKKMDPCSEDYVTFNPVNGNQGQVNVMIVDEDTGTGAGAGTGTGMKNVPVFRKPRHNLKNLEDDFANNLNGSAVSLNNMNTANNLSNFKSLNNPHNPMKDYSDLKIMPAVKHKSNVITNNLQNSFTMKNSLLNGEKVNVGNFRKFTFNAIQDESDEEVEDEVHFEGYLYKISRGKKLKKRYFKLIHKDLYHYRNKGDSSHKGLHNLGGVFIQEGQPLQFNEFYFYSFSMIFCNKTRVYYSDNEAEFKEWIRSIKQSTGYSNLSETYDVKEKLGNGKFGLVRLGVHKDTGRKVAVKIMYKGDMTISDLELVKTEIEILKVCQHPNIIRLYDVYENAEYIYISNFYSYLIVKFKFIPNSNGALSGRRFILLPRKKKFQITRVKSGPDNPQISYCSLLPTFLRHCS